MKDVLRLAAAGAAAACATACGGDTGGCSATVDTRTLSVTLAPV